MKLVDVSEEQKKTIQKGELILLDELDRICTKYDIKYMLAYGSLIGAIRHNGFIPWDDDIDVCMMRCDYIRFKEACIQEFGGDGCLSDKFFYQSNDTDPEYFYLFDKIRLKGTIFKESFVSKYNINHGIYIDIFPIDYLPENRFFRLLQTVEFHFLRTGLMSKYPMLGPRTKAKKIIFGLLRIPYSVIPLSFLYAHAHKVAMRYDAVPHLKAGNFFTAYHGRDYFDASIYTNLIRHRFEDIEIWIPKNYDLYLSQLYGDYMKLPPVEQRATRHSITEIDVSSVLR